MHVLVTVKEACYRNILILIQIRIVKLLIAHIICISYLQPITWSCELLIFISKLLPEAISTNVVVIGLRFFYRNWVEFVWLDSGKGLHAKCFSRCICTQDIHCSFQMILKLQKTVILGTNVIRQTYLAYLNGWSYSNCLLHTGYSNIHYQTISFWRMLYPP